MFCQVAQSSNLPQDLNSPLFFPHASSIAVRVREDRSHGSRKIWVTHPESTRANPRPRMHILLESRADVIRLLLEHLDAGRPARAPHRMRQDEGPQAAPAPQAGGRRRRSLVQVAGPLS